MTNWRWKGMDTVIFAPDLIEHAFVGVSHSDAKFMGGEYSNATQFINVCVYMLHYLTPPKKACLKLFCTWNGCNYCFLEESQQRVRGRRERIFFHTYSLIWNVRKAHYLNILFSMPSYFLFASGNKKRFGTWSCAIPALSKLLATLHFLASGSFLCTVASLFFICDFAKLRCTSYIALNCNVYNVRCIKQCYRRQEGQLIVLAVANQ